jgi:hypothetical protein
LPGGRSRWRLPQSRDRGLQRSTHCGYCVHGTHLLPMDHDRQDVSTPATRCAAGITPVAVSLSNAPPTATPSSVMGPIASAPGDPALADQPVHSWAAPGTGQQISSSTQRKRHRKLDLARNGHHLQAKAVIWARGRADRTSPSRLRIPRPGNMPSYPADLPSMEVSRLGRASAGTMPLERHAATTGITSGFLRSLSLPAAFFGATRSGRRDMRHEFTPGGCMTAAGRRQRASARARRERLPVTSRRHSRLSLPSILARRY